MTLFEAFPLFVSFLISFFVVKYYALQFGFVQWVIAIVVGCVLFCGYVGVRVLFSVLRGRRESSVQHDDNRGSP